MKVTVYLPEYVYDVLKRKAEHRKLDIEGLLRREAIDTADATMKAWWSQCRSMRCECGQYNPTEIGMWNPPPPKKCTKCGTRLAKKYIGPDLEEFLRETHRKRRLYGYADPVFVSLEDALSAALGPEGAAP